MLLRVSRDDDRDADGLALQELPRGLRLIPKNPLDHELLVNLASFAETVCDACDAQKFLPWGSQGHTRVLRWDLTFQECGAIHMSQTP